VTSLLGPAPPKGRKDAIFVVRNGTCIQGSHRDGSVACVSGVNQLSLYPKANATEDVGKEGKFALFIDQNLPYLVDFHLLCSHISLLWGSGSLIARFDTAKMPTQTSWNNHYLRGKYNIISLDKSLFMLHSHGESS
jgi:hypothetical protein